MAEDTFSDKELQDAGRPIKSLLVRYFLKTSNIVIYQILFFCIPFASGCFPLILVNPIEMFS